MAGLLRSACGPGAPPCSPAPPRPGFGPHLGLPQRADELLDVGSPFDYPANGLIYCAARLPRPTDPRWADAAIDELAALIEAAGGRTLGAVHQLQGHAPGGRRAAATAAVPLLAQGDLPKPALIDRFAREPETCLFATMSFWQGIDVPGPSLSLVTIDRLPFPRPDDPLLQARREHAGPGAFVAIDVPRAATLLAQGAGRLIRTATDRGAVAVLDPRLATARYGPKIVATLPRCAAPATGPRSRPSCASLRAGPRRRLPPRAGGRQSEPEAVERPGRRCQSLSTLTCSSRYAPSGSCSRTAVPTCLEHRAPCGR